MQTRHRSSRPPAPDRLTLRELIHQTRFESAANEALLNVLVTASWLHGEIAATLAPHGITNAQYNVLRILRGRHPGCATCSEIGDRLLDRTPDVTRLLVRLESAGWVRRQRAEHDRRVVEVEITDAGRTLLAALDGPMAETTERLTHHLSNDDLKSLSGLLETMRTDQT